MPRLSSSPSQVQKDGSILSLLKKKLVPLATSSTILSYLEATRTGVSRLRRIHRNAFEWVPSQVHPKKDSRASSSLQSVYYLQADRVAGISNNAYVRCWVDYNHGTITSGTGQVGSQPCYSWKDVEPISGIQHAGLGTWDKHVCFRNIELQPPKALRCGSAIFSGKRREYPFSSVPSLLHLSQAAVLDSLSIENVLSALLTVELLSPFLDGIVADLISFAARRLPSILQSDLTSFSLLPAALIAELVGNPYLDCSERQVFDAIILWAYGECPDSAQSLAQSLSDTQALLLLVRFPLMSSKDLQDIRSHRFCSQSPLLLRLVAEAEEATGPSAEGMGLGPLAEREAEKCRALPEFCPRHWPACQNLMFVFSGDSNGVSHWLGTAYGCQHWVNPVLAGMMEVGPSLDQKGGRERSGRGLKEGGWVTQVQASSPSCKHTDPRALVSGKFLRLNLAGPGKNGAAWWQIDLGRRHRLICNHYTLRHDASFDFPAAWALQGSNDGAGWVDLQRQEGGSSICMPEQSASWPVSGRAASLPYRLFRVLLTGPNRSPLGNRTTFHLSSFELYGKFFRLSQGLEQASVKTEFNSEET